MGCFDIKFLWHGLRNFGDDHIEPFGSAHAKMLFGLCGAILILTEGSHGEKDLTENHLPQMVGNRVAKISDVVIGTEVREHEVAAHLWRCLAKVQR